MDKKITRSFAYVLHLGITMIVPVLLTIFIGYLIKGWFKVDAMLACVICGILAGIRNCYMLLKEEIKTQKKESKNDAQALSYDSKTSADNLHEEVLEDD